MKSKEALDKLKNHDGFIPLGEELELYGIIEKDLEILEEIRAYFKVIDYGEEYQNRYAIQVMYPYPAGFIYSIRKDVYDKWNRWLGNDK